MIALELQLGEPIHRAVLHPRDGREGANHLPKRPETPRTLRCFDERLAAQSIGRPVAQTRQRPAQTL